MKKKFFVCGLLALSFSLSALCGCFMPERSIASIEKTESIGLVDYYTITYTDGTTSTYTVTNGKDGADGLDGEDGEKGADGADAPVLTVDDVYEFYKQTDPDMTKEEFVEKFINLQNSGRGIASIEKTESVGLVDYYTITYTDGTTSTYTVTNGKDGADGRDGIDGEDGADAPALTVEDVYEFYKQTDPDITIEEFVERFLSVENGGASQDNLNALSSLFKSSLRIYTVFNESSTSTKESSYTGSGVIYKIDSDYTYILTNYHMIYDENAVTTDKTPKKIFAYMYGSNYSPVVTQSNEIVLADDDKFGLTCEYVGGTAECDVAIVKVPTSELTAKYPYAKAVTINQSYEVGQTVYALGNPNGQGLSLTKGIISVDLESVTLDNAGEHKYYLLRTDADLDHGSSGGGLFNAAGELVGLCNSGSDTVVSINYAIPAATVAPCAESILYYNALDGGHSIYRLRLGVTVFEDNCRYVYDSETDSGSIKADITVTEPDTGSSNPTIGLPAYSMGLRAGDVIKAISFNGTKYTINRMADMTNVLMQVRAGDRVTITIVRGNEEIESTAYTVAQSDLVSM